MRKSQLSFNTIAVIFVAVVSSISIFVSNEIIVPFGHFRPTISSPNLEDGVKDRDEDQDEDQDEEEEKKKKSATAMRSENENGEDSVMVETTSTTTVTMEDRMLPELLELLPEEILTIPVWNETTTTINNKNETTKQLVSGGIPMVDKRSKQEHCPNSIIENEYDDDPMGRCCIGAVSNGGGQDYTGVEGKKPCLQDIEIYETVQRLALGELKAHPVQSPNKNEALLKCDVCRILQILASMKHRKFALMGDSLQSQVFVALECELRRRNFTVVAGPTREWPSENERLKVVNDTIGIRRADWKYGIKRQRCIRITVPEWMTTHLKGHHRHHFSPLFVDVCLYTHYRPYPDMEQHLRIASSHDAVMINYGVHYLHKDKEILEFTQSLESLFRVFRDHVPESLLLYRETSAQHFETDGGEYKQRRESKLCVPNNPEDDLVKWRTKIFDSVANRTGVSVVKSFGRTTTTATAPKQQEQQQQQQQQQVAFLPFWDFTSQLNSLHREGDCTHFCYTPHTFYPLWRHIRSALDDLDAPQQLLHAV